MRILANWPLLIVVSSDGAMCVCKHTTITTTIRQRDMVVRQARQVLSSEHETVYSWCLGSNTVGLGHAEVCCGS